MVIARIIMLGFLIAAGVLMGYISLQESNGFATFVALTLCITIPALYLLPIYEAASRNHANTTSIVLINVLMGWSILGWLFALIWAIKEPENNGFPIDNSEYKACPYCAEKLLKAAIKCKHCGAMLVNG